MEFPGEKKEISQYNVGSPYSWCWLIKSMEKVFPLWKNTGFFKIINVWKQFQSSMSETLNCGKLIHVPKSIGLVQ